MFVLGVDPGVSRCGYGLLRAAGSTGSGSRAVTAGLLTTPVDHPLPQRLGMLQQDLEELIAEYRPDVVVVERVFFQTNVRTAMSVGQASGLALSAAWRAGCDVAQYTANEVKQAVAGDGAASKLQVQRMVQSLLQLDQRPDPPDVADALALALCHVGRAGWESKVKASKNEASKKKSASEKVGTAG
jgi:crossover junction endodeoxyribonuclease RuvC